MENVQPSQERTLGDVPAAVWILATGVGLIGSGWALEWGGYGVEAGLSAALGLVFVAIAVLGHLIVWTLGKID